MMTIAFTTAILPSLGAVQVQEQPRNRLRLAKNETMEQDAMSMLAQAMKLR